MSNFLWRLGKKINRVAKTALYILEEPFEEKQLFWKEFNFKTFFGLWAKYFRPNFFKKILRSQRNMFTKKGLFWKYHVFSGFMQKIFRIFGRNVLARWGQLLFSYPAEHVSWKIFTLAKPDIFFKSPSWSKTFSIVVRNLFDSIVKSGIYVSLKLSEEKEFSFWHKCFPYSFEDFDRNIFEFSVKKFCRKLHSTYPEGKKWWNFLLSENWNCSTTSGIWMKNLLNSCWKTSARLSKVYLRVQATFEGKIM